MTMNSLLPMFTDHKFCARWPPFSQEASIRNLPMMLPVRYPQRQSPLLTPPANFILPFEIRAQTTRMARPEVFASAIRSDVASAGCHPVGNRSSSTHFENLLCDLFSNESQGRIRSIPGDDSGLSETMLAVERAQDCIKHTVKILRKILSKERRNSNRFVGGARMRRKSGLHSLPQHDLPTPGCGLACPQRGLSVSTLCMSARANPSFVVLGVL